MCEKNIYEDLRLEVVRFAVDDVITTSGDSLETAELDEIED